MLSYLDTLIGFAMIMLGSSLLITIATQLISALLSHRGANLRWGLVTLFENIPNSPLLATLAERLATDALTHPLISDSIFSKRLPIPIPRWFADRFRLATAIHPDELIAILQDIAARPDYQAVAGLPAEIDAQATRLKAWFNATMDRVSQRFTTYMRLWTIAFAAAFALITGLNSVNLLSTLYTNGDFRQQLTGAAPQIMDLANRVAPEGPQDIATRMFTQLVANALQTSGAKADAPPSGIESEAAGEAWIMSHVIDGAQSAAAIHALNTAVLDQRTRDAATIRTILTKSSFDVLQFRWQRGPVWPQLPGVLATAALLSLGAPFWFNMLKQLSNLRPILATKADTPDSP
jgi:hypothetical protein